MTSIILLNGCVYYVQPEKPKDKPLEIVQDDSSPTSYSYPLPDRPKIINNYVSSEPYPIDNDQINVVDSQQANDENNIENSASNNEQSDPTIDNDQNQPRDATGGNDNQQDQLVGANPQSGSPVGTYANPITFDQSKVY